MASCESQCNNIKKMKTTLCWDVIRVLMKLKKCCKAGKSMPFALARKIDQNLSRLMLFEESAQDEHEFLVYH